MKLLQLCEIWVYPIKSLGGVSLKSAKVLPKGLQWDRRWMLVDENGVFLTQRKHSKLALFKITIGNESLTVKFGDDELAVPFQPHTSDDLELKIWDDTVSGLEVSFAHSEWFSQRLNTSCKLVFFPENNPRLVDSLYAIDNDHTSLSDAYPFLVIGQSSLDNLNEKLREPVPIDRFRPNFLFSGGEPFEEDFWRELTIGTNKFVGVKPCSRCVIPTINQTTGEKGIEPLKTLATYRQRNGKVYFGQNLIARDHQEVHVGDEIRVFEYLQKNNEGNHLLKKHPSSHLLP